VWCRGRQVVPSQDDAAHTACRRNAQQSREDLHTSPQNAIPQSQLNTGLKIARAMTAPIDQRAYRRNVTAGMVSGGAHFPVWQMPQRESEAGCYDFICSRWSWAIAN